MFEQVRIGDLQLLRQCLSRPPVWPGCGRSRFLAASASSILMGSGFKPVAWAATATAMLRAHIPSSSIMPRSVTWTFGLLSGRRDWEGSPADTADGFGK